MTKPWDLVELKARLARAGVSTEALILVEKFAKKIVPIALAWAKESIALKGGLVKRVALWFGWGTLESEVNKWVDGIDGVKGN